MCNEISATIILLLRILIYLNSKENKCTLLIHVIILVISFLLCISTKFLQLYLFSKDSYVSLLLFFFKFFHPGLTTSPVPSGTRRPEARRSSGEACGGLGQTSHRLLANGTVYGSSMGLDFASIASSKLANMGPACLRQKLGKDVFSCGKPPARRPHLPRTHEYLWQFEPSWRLWAIGKTQASRTV